MSNLTISDLDLFYSGMGGHPFLDLDGLRVMQKAAPILTSTSGYLNAVFGARAWAQLNEEANAFSIMPKTDWDRSGVRIIQALESTYTDLGIGESDTLPASIKPTVSTITLTPKIQAKTFELSDVMEGLIQLGADDIFGSMDQLRHFRGMDFARGINKMLLKDVEAEAGAAGANYAEGKLIQSLDRALSNDTEEDNYGGSYTGFYDWYDIDRDAATTYGDCYVAQDATADQELDDELLRQTIANAKKLGGKTTVMLSGWDTYAQIQGIYQSYMRYNQMAETQVEFGINGIKSAKGIDGGTPMASVLGIPLLLSQDISADGSDRIYGLDTSDAEGFGEPRISINTIRPVEYFESRDFLALNKFVAKGAYRYVAELAIRHFPGQFKIRDISA